MPSSLAAANPPGLPALPRSQALSSTTITATSAPHCRFFGTGDGCRKGDNCPFLHDVAMLPVREEKELAASQEDGSSMLSSSPQNSGVDRRQAITQPVLESRVVPKPIPQAQQKNPREFQLGQIRRRFSPKETRDSQDGTVLSFNMAPSDPDFPFEMQALQCILTVPKSYPGKNDESRPRLRVKNQEVARGFAINIEKGFDTLVEERPDATLLAIMHAVDNNLESFLSKKPAETIKLVANADTRHLGALPTRAVGEVSTPAPPQKSTPRAPKVARKPEVVFTAAQKAEAKGRRDAETRQLEVRLGRLPLYKKSSDGIAYTLPIEPRRRSELPIAIQAVKSVQLFVPVLYPLQNCRIQLEGVNPEEALNIELAFGERTTQFSTGNLMGHVNYLAQNMHILAKHMPSPKSKPASQVDEDEKAPTVADEVGISPALKGDDDRSHVKFIPRPPEWDVDDSDISDSNDEDEWDSNEYDEQDAADDPGSAGPASSASKNPEHGTSLSFPSLELYNIELLEVTSLNMTVKCIRCRTAADMPSLPPNIPKSTSCLKCGTNLTATFRKDLMHTHASRAGFLDLTGCTPLDMLPSTFLPTCSTCSTTYPAPGIIAVRGDASTAVCRTCHAKLTLKIPEVRFLRITAAAAPAPTSGPKRREALGITAGTELPDHGACRHYAKSYRWFRFSCCEKVYPCDKCHDEGEEHGNEHANRMICGWCSREQRYKPDECGFCGRGVVGRKGRGFWEGGRGTRDQVRMSRKDPRKYKRIGSAKKD